MNIEVYLCEKQVLKLYYTNIYLIAMGNTPLSCYDE